MILETAQILGKKTENIRFNANNAKKFEGSAFFNMFL